MALILPILFLFLISSEEVKSMSPQNRKCLFNDDDWTIFEPKIILDSFKNYSYNACLLECKARAMMQYCNCLPYYFPDFSESWNMSTDCDVQGLKCLNGIECKYSGDLKFEWLKYRRHPKTKSAIQILNGPPGHVTCLKESLDHFKRTYFNLH